MKHFLDKMQDGRDRAMAARNRGEHTGKSAKGWNRAQVKVDCPVTRAIIVMRAEWQSAKIEALNDYRVAILHGSAIDPYIPF